MAQKVYSQQHNTGIDCIPGTDRLGTRSCHFSPLQLVSLGKSDALLKKHLVAVSPENRENTDAVVETRAKDKSQIVNKAMRKVSAL